MKSPLILMKLLGLIALSAFTAQGATFIFTTPPFEGSTALTTPGRQLVGGEPTIQFNTATDVFVFDRFAFSMESIQFANAAIDSVPASGVNTIVLLTFDNDSDPSTPFGAGTAANLLANQITSSGPGLFIYFNSSLDLPRLVYSTDLSDNTADLKVIARMENFAGQAGRDAMAGFSSSNFEIRTVPDSGSHAILLLAAASLLGATRLARRRRAPTAS